MATAFNGQTFTFTQPDGSKIQLRGSGTELRRFRDTRRLHGNQKPSDWLL